MRGNLGQPVLMVVVTLAAHHGVTARMFQGHDGALLSNRTAPQLQDMASQTLACFLAATQCPLDPASAAMGNSLDAPDGSMAGDPGNTQVSAHWHYHKPLWPLGWQDVTGFVATAAAMLLAAAGGVGGGGLLIPIFMIILGFPSSAAVALSNTTVLAGTATNTFLNIRRRHPLRPGPLIDWDLILVMEPSTILGAMAGGYINRILPSWLTTLCLSLLLAFVTVNLVRRGRAVYRKEARQLRCLRESLTSPKLLDSNDEGSCAGGEQAGGEEDSAAARAPQLRGADGEGDAGQPLELPPAPTAAQLPRSPAHASSSPLAELKQPLLSSSEGESAAAGASAQQPARGIGQGETGPAGRAGRGTPGQWGAYASNVPVKKLAVLVALLIGVVLSDVVRSLLPCPSLPYWLAALAMVPITILVLVAVREHLIRAHGSRVAAADYVAVEGDVAWTRQTTIVYPLICTSAGLVAGLFGVGGGIIKGPLMLEMGVLPQVAAATSAAMIMFTSAAACVVFISFGAVQWDYALPLFAIAVAFTALGQVATKRLMRRMGGRSSIIVFAMAALLGASAMVLGLQGGLSSRAAFVQHAAWDWGSVCGDAHG